MISEKKNNKKKSIFKWFTLKNKQFRAVRYFKHFFHLYNTWRFYLSLLILIQICAIK